MFYLAVAAFFGLYLASSGSALWLRSRSRQTEDRAVKHGNSGEQRVDRILSQAGYLILTDLTIKQGGRTHQIDHVVCGQDRLFVIETKTWRGRIEGRAGERSWTLTRPEGRASLSIYNPLFQNRTHAQVIGAITRAPVTPLVVSAGFIRTPPELADRVISLAGLPAMLGPPGAPTGRTR